MINVITDLNASDFLLFYFTVIVAATAVCGWRRFYADATRAMPVPFVPAEPDPYEIAWLRGGPNEVTRIAIVHLTQLGYLQAVSARGGKAGKSARRRIEQQPDAPDTGRLTQLEREVFGWFAPCRTLAEVFKAGALSSLVASQCLAYAEKSQKERLVTSDAARSAALATGIVAGAAVFGLGFARLVVGVSRDRPVGFLIMMGIVGLVVIGALSILPRLSSRGSRWLQQLRDRFDELKQRGHSQLIPGEDYTLLASVYGVAVLAGTPYAYFPDMFKRSSAADGGGGWVGCGDGGGGGGGGGGSGCGGGGCGGCGG